MDRTGGMKTLLVGLLDALAQGAHVLHHSRRLRLALAAMVGLAIVATALARPVHDEDTTVYTVSLRDITAASIGRYVRVTGVLAPEAAYQTQFTALGIRLRGGRFIPMLGEGAYDPLFVLDQNLPPLPDNGAPLTLVGRIVPGSGQQPTYYLEVGDPPDIALMNSLARLGLIVLVCLVAAFGLIWYLRRADYAPGLPFGSPAVRPGAPPLLWFGSVGRTYGDVVLRQEPATFVATRAEALFGSARRPGAWTATCRRLLSADTTVVATRYGALPAARIEFEDERGLRRRAVLATSSLPARNALIEALRFVGLHGA